MATKFKPGDRVLVSPISEGDLPYTVVSGPDEEGDYKVIQDYSEDWVYERGTDLILAVEEVNEVYPPIQLIGTWPDSTDDPIARPSHYREGMPSGVEVIDIIRAQDAGFEHANVLKYILRWKYKGTPVEDLKKARQYLDWLIEKESGK